jgi:hypothetical protein
MSGSAIPAGQIVSVVPSVLNAGGVGLDLLGLVITYDNHIPIDQVYSFPDLTSVQAFFGPTSYISMLAGTYFLADINATKRPGALLMATWTGGGRWLPAWLRSAQLPAMTLPQLQATQANSTTLASATSFSMAAQMIGAAIPYYGSPMITQASGTISGTTLRIISHGAVGGSFQAGSPITGPGIPAGTYIINGIATTDNWLTGTFTINRTLNITTPITIKAYVNCCTWDSATFQFMIAVAPFLAPNTDTTTRVPTMSHLTGWSGNLATQIGLSQSTGARLQPMGMSWTSGGRPLDSVAACMDNILKLTQNWASFTTDFDIDAVAGTTNTYKQQFAAWTNLQQNNYLYVAWDLDRSPTVSPNAQSSLGRILNTNLTSGTVPISSTSVTNGRNLAMFTMGTIAAIDFNRLNGRKTLAFRGQTGIVPEVTSGAVASNLESNFYNYYGIWTTANDLFRFLYPGLVSGPYRWIDSYVNQIWMNNAFQLALMDLLTQAGSIPYNQVGYTMIKAACQDVINRAVNFGAIRIGVVLSQAQVAEVNTMAGVEIDRILQSNGYYLQVLDPPPEVRVSRGTPPMTFWYMDGGSIQRLTLASVMVQ